MKRNYTAILRLIGFNFPLNLVVFNPDTSSCIKHVKWSKRGADVSELRPHQMSGNLIIGGYWVTGRWLNSIRWRVAGEFFHRKKKSPLHLLVPPFTPHLWSEKRRASCYRRPNSRFGLPTGCCRRLCCSNCFHRKSEIVLFHADEKKNSAEFELGIRAGLDWKKEKIVGISIGFPLIRFGEKWISARRVDHRARQVDTC